MFYEKLNKELRAFEERSTLTRYSHNVWNVGNNSYYVEYYEEKLYWVKDYTFGIVSMVRANNPKEAVEKVNNTK